MNDVMVYYANGTKMMYSIFPDETYDEGRKAGYIVGIKNLNWFEKILCRIRGL